MITSKINISLSNLLINLFLLLNFGVINNDIYFLLVQSINLLYPFSLISDNKLGIIIVKLLNFIIYYFLRVLKTDFFNLNLNFS